MCMSELVGPENKAATWLRYDSIRYRANVERSESHACTRALIYKRFNGNANCPKVLCALARSRDSREFSSRD